MRPFIPLVRNAHFLTIAGNFWVRRLDEQLFPVEATLYRTEPDVQVLVHTQRPHGAPIGEIVLVHGLEGSSEAGYMMGAAQAGLEAGFVVHRFNMRSCGAAEALCATLYHSGLTGDLLAVLRQLHVRGRTPLGLCGFSLGGNVVLKLAGELGEEAHSLVAAVCAVSTPIDLATCVRRLHEPVNWLYEQRFLLKMKKRLRMKQRLMPERFTVDGLERVRTVFEFDNRFTAPFFGFRGADHYYSTQSAARFLHLIRVPALLIQAQDDPLVPFHLFAHPAFECNPYLKLEAPAHGGHLGFISREPPRFWSDEVVLEWLLKWRNKSPAARVF